MVVTATEFKSNFGKYLELVTREDVFITRNGKTIAKAINPHVSAVDYISGLLAESAPANISTDILREERLSKYENNV